ncbi:MAG: hypothetical protein QM750_11860 [Rubrivivax sp.]
MAEATTTPSIEQLRLAVKSMDGLSQEGFSAIANDQQAGGQGTDHV